MLIRKGTELKYGLGLSLMRHMCNIALRTQRSDKSLCRLPCLPVRPATPRLNIKRDVFAGPNEVEFSRRFPRQLVSSNSSASHEDKCLKRTRDHGAKNDGD